jgi:hypothetical protein
VARIGFVLLAVIADRIDELNGYRGWLEDGETVDLRPRASIQAARTFGLTAAPLPPIESEPGGALVVRRCRQNEEPLPGHPVRARLAGSFVAGCHSDDEPITSQPPPEVDAAPLL